MTLLTAGTGTEDIPLQFGTLLEDSKLWAGTDLTIGLAKTGDSFDGSYGSFNGSTSLALNNTATALGDADMYYDIIFKMDTFASTDAIWNDGFGAKGLLLITEASKFTFYILGTATDTVSIDNADFFTAGNWTRIICERSGTDVTVTGIDLETGKTVVKTGTSSSDALTGKTLGMAIGAYPDSTRHSAIEVRSLKVGTSSTSLLHTWRFTSNNTTSVEDTTGSLDLTFTDVTMQSEATTQASFRSIKWGDLYQIPSYLLDAWMKWQKTSGKSCSCTEIITTTEFGLTDTTYGNMDTYATSATCGAGTTDFSALKDSGGNYIYDSNGENIFTKDDR